MTSTQPANDALVLERVGKTYGRHRALADVSTRFEPGCVATVLGPNGAGKSTLLALLTTLVPPSTGRLSWGDHNLGSSSPLRARIGYVGHEPGLYGEWDARANLVFFARLYGVADPEARARALIARVGLADVRPDAPVRTFSRGMQQRLALARGLVAEPALLLFDEPGSALDPAGAAWLETEVRRERDAGRIVILVTHDLDAAAAVTNHVLVLRRGRVAHDERRAFTPDELRALYREVTTRGG